VDEKGEGEGKKREGENGVIKARREVFRSRFVSNQEGAMGLWSYRREGMRPMRMEKSNMCGPSDLMPCGCYH
jgi:hypothetical protein